MNNNFSKRLIFGKFELLRKIGEGSFGIVYLAMNVRTMELVAIKLEPLSNPALFLKTEAIYLFMLKDVGIPKLKGFGKNRKYNILVETLLGDSLSSLMKKYNMHMPLKDTLMIAIQVIERLEYLHSKFLIHRDIKPENFLIGYDDPYIIYLIDFGLCKKYRSTRTGNHIKFSVLKRTTGTPIYASVSIMKGNQVSRRDDFESIAYMLIYLMKGILPWSLVKGKTKAEKFRKIYQMKILCTPEKLCEGLPNEIMEFLIYCKNLHFEEEPKYEYCYSLFNRALAKSGFSNDLIFSWIKEPQILFKLKHLKSIDKSIMRLNKRKSSPQTRIYHSLRNSFAKTKSLNQSPLEPDIVNLLNNKSFHKNKRYLKRFQNNELLFHSLSNDESFKTNEYMKQKNNMEFHKKYRRISLKHGANSGNCSDKHLNKIIPKYSTEQNQNNTFQKNIKIKNENKATSFKINSRIFTRNLNKGLKLKNIYMIGNKNVGKDKRPTIHNSIYTYNNTDIKNISFNNNNNYIKKIQNVTKNKNNIIINNIRKIQQKNKNKSKLINIIHNNIINSDINMLINVHKENNGKQNNRNENKSGKKSDINANLNDIIGKSQIGKLKYRSIITQNRTLTTTHKINNRKIINYQLNNTNSYLINNNKTKQIRYSSITENNSFRQIVDKKFRFDGENKNTKLNRYKISKIQRLKTDQGNFQTFFANKGLKKIKTHSKNKTLIDSQFYHFSSNPSLNKLYNDKIHNKIMNNYLK